MAFLRTHTALLLRLHLLLFLLATQSMAIAHELDHLGADDVNICTVCSVAHTMDSAVVASDELPVTEPGFYVVHTPVQTVSVEAQISCQSARAPPVSL